MSETNSQSLGPLLRRLDIPPEFARYSSIQESEVLARLQEWRRQACAALSALRSLCQEQETLSLQERGEVIAAVAPFDSEGPWIVDASREQAQGILRLYGEPDMPLLEELLKNHVKPVFRTNPHPSLNPATGRTLPRPAGGPLGHLDHFEGQAWKLRPGAVYLVSWCVRHIQSSAYEKLWHLVIPPVMTMLDDFEAVYKLQGVCIASDMLKAVPADLLRRTGVDGLLFNSLRNCMTFLKNPETPDLIRASVLAARALVECSTTPGSAQRFDRLCAILGEGIIGSVWVHASGDLDTLEASVDVLPDIIRTLDIGTVRYLKALIPQLVFPLQPIEGAAPSISLQLSSLRALSAVIQTCAPRMCDWKCTILEGVLKCWVTLVDSGSEGDDTQRVKTALGEVCDQLLLACPSVKEDEYARLLRLDSEMFGPLLESRYGSG
ncbi:hypothetical protein OBBRIDRAFT_787731 [Obba rivulosa]|uniref:Uncharacterized protein n=1 Tax=Obba rivulosa TaxID=1052685 RepID=A0A8E2DTX0_9APHY|nr:hypothetical protein OBBRIDRAFT_787731 [Obba rivulosa]